MSERLSDTPDESIQENKENVTLIWFKSVLNTNDEIEKAKKDLRTINNSVLFHNNIDIFNDYMKSISRDSVFLIISGDDISKHLSPTIHNLRQLDSIFIFPDNRDEYNRLFDQFNKIVNIFATHDELVISIKENINGVNNQNEIFSFYDQHKQSILDLSAQSAKFLWFQLFNDVIFHLPRGDEGKEEMISACRQYYRNNRKVLKQVDEFNETYTKAEYIKWYTKDAFVYRLINRALRTEDIEQLYTFRYYIVDLSNQLAQEYQKFKRGLEETIQSYRGMIMSKKEAETLKANEGKLIATNGYWSTTRNESCALKYIQGHTNDADKIAVLFKIECDFEDKNDSIIFADIILLSEYPEEQEILFDIGAVFKIEKITEETRENTDILVVQIKASGEGREIARKYMEENRKEMEDESPTIMLCTLLKRMEKFEKSFNFLQRLVENPGKENLAHIHNRIGIALKDENKYDDALTHFDKALTELTNPSTPSQRKYSAFVFHNKGLVYAKRRLNDEALGFYLQAIQILETEIGPNNCGIAQFYNSMGRAYFHKKIYDKALAYQRKSLKMRRECLPSDHVINAFNYTDIANIYSRQGDNDQALEKHQQALKLRKECLPSDHHNIAWSLHQVGKIHYKMGNSQKAQDCYQESLKIKRKCQSASVHNSIPSILEDIALIYGCKSEEARKCRSEALEIQRNIEPADYSALAFRLDRLAFTCKSMNRLNDSLEYYQEALDIQRNIEPADYSTLAFRLDRLALTCKSMNRLNDSLKYYQEAFDIRTKYPSDNQLDLACSFKNIASVCEKIGENTRALDYYYRAKDIYYRNYEHNLYQETRRNIARVKQSLRQQRMCSDFSIQMNINRRQ